MLLTVRVDGMSCTHCVQAVFTALTAVEGIVRADVSIGQVRIEHDGRVRLEAVTDAIEVAGYQVSGAEADGRHLPVL
jgi:copper chaperone